MGYIFSGFFAIADEIVLQKALEKWPYCFGKVINTPFKGIGVSSPIERFERLDDPTRQYPETELPEWSANFPSVIFVFITVNCWAGICGYAGYVCSNGKILLQEEYENGKSDELRLSSLLAYLGVQSRIFEPFTRGYFENT